MRVVLVFFLFLNVFLFSEPKLLIKIATRERTTQFFDCLQTYYDNLSGNCDVVFLVSCDSDDLSMNNPDVISQMEQLPNLFFYFSKRCTKIEAINRDVEKHLDFDVLLCASDDMFVAKKNFDEIICTTMLETFPDLDGVLNFNDGYTDDRLNTYPILGKKYYERFGYIYHPEYKSFYCDLELTIVSRMLKKDKSVLEILIEHRHPAAGYSEDNLYRHNDSMGMPMHDKLLFYKRRACNFELKEEEILEDSLPTSLDTSTNLRDNLNVKWSILICTLDERTLQFQRLYTKLLQQIEKFRLTTQVEVIFFKDNRTHSVGYKRNKLLENSRGKYVCFIDDDDDISDAYVSLIYNALKSNPDCVSLVGRLIEEGKKTCKFCHSNHFKTYSSKGNKYFRPPNHLNTIKAEIAKKFKFPERNRHEDLEWAMQLAQSGLLKREAKVSEVLYFYLYNHYKYVKEL
jgi:hypothetical protein